MAFEFFHSTVDDSPACQIPELGLELTVRLPPGVTGSALTLIETRNAPGFGPPLHRHHETEVFRVLEGRYLFEVNGRRFEAGEGELISVPGGDAHTFLNITDRPARQLVLMLPAVDAEKFFVSLGRVLASGPAKLGVLNDFGQAWGVEFLGPPLRLRDSK